MIMKFYTLLTSLSLFLFATQAQSQAIPIDKAIMSGIGLKQVKLKNDPERAFFQTNLYRGEDISVYMLSSQSATTNFDPMPFDEFVLLVDGSSVIEPSSGEKKQFYKGDYILAPKGYNGLWKVEAGNRYHLELSVISNKRATSIAENQDLTPFIIDPTDLSGLERKDEMQQVLLDGVELNITLNAEEAGERKISDNQEELVIHILSGKVDLKAEGQPLQTFYTGDFFILPKGFSGSWKSSAQDLFRCIYIKKAADL